MASARGGMQRDRARISMTSYREVDETGAQKEMAGLLTMHYDEKAISGSYNRVLQPRNVNIAVQTCFVCIGLSSHSSAIATT